MNMGRSARRWFVRLVLVALVAGVAPAAAASSSSAAQPYCGIRWGSQEKSSTGRVSASTLRGIRAGRHACFDRLVLDLGGDHPTYVVYYKQDIGQLLPTGVRVRSDVGATLVVGVDGTGRRHANPSQLVDVGGFRTFRQVGSMGCGCGSFGLFVGTRARLPFRTFVLDDGHTSRLVIDVAHRW